jgi:prepilin-type N-terminal cleavage/methylation domain-containing protein/prepilin-type processing-associated H-X9-DG protein
MSLAAFSLRTVHRLRFWEIAMLDVSKNRRRSAFTLVELLVVIAIIGVLVALLLPAVQTARESSRRMACNNNLRQIGLGFQMFHDVNNRFPSGGDKQAGIKYLIGWPAQVFPFIEQKALRDQIDGLTTNALLNVMPWRSLGAPHFGNSPMYTSLLKVFACPSSELGKKSPDAWKVDPDVNAINQAPLHYRANGGSAMQELVQGTQSRHAWYSKSGVVYPNGIVRVADITDGTSNTLLAGETSSAFGRALVSRSWGGIQPWTWGYYNYNGAGADSPQGWLMIDHKVVTYPIGYVGSFFTNETPWTSAHPNGVNMIFVDGSSRFQTKQTPLALLQAQATRGWGEAVTEQ